MISIKNLYLKYIREYYALYDINLEIKKGETVFIVGEEQSGKTSLLRVIAKVEKFNKGEIYIKDIPLKKLSFENDISMCYLPEKPIFLPNKTVYQNFISLLSDRKVPEKERENVVNKCFIEYNIEKLRDTKIEDLSLYEKYIVSLVRFTFRNIEIALIDNIFDKLSADEVTNILEMINKIFPPKKQILIIATTKTELTKKIKGRIINFENGSIINEQKSM